MSNVFRLIQSVFNELLIIFLLIFIINNYFGNMDETIKSDGSGYYDYLPSLFIYHDLNRHTFDQKFSPEKFNRIKSIGVYVNYKSSLVNKYSCGTAILESPFFLGTYFLLDKSEIPDNGYQVPYQRAIFYAAVFYVFLTIFFLKKILQLYKCGYFTILIMQLLIVLATSVTNYVNFDASYSHIYSLFAITAFIYFTKSYFENRNFRNFYLACVLLGIIVILRPVNGMIIFFIPFIAGSFTRLKEEFVFLMHNFLKMSVGILIVISIVFIQCLLWYLQTGDFIVYTYGNEGFNFSKPEVFNVLFSYRKGLFVYTPVLLLTMSALIWFGIKRRFFEFFSWVTFFILITYVISAWWCWYYGDSYGLRAYVDFYTIFFILIAIMYDKLSVWLKVAFLIPALLFTYLNIVQTYQYKNFILHWGEMDKQKYWNVFLKTAEPYKGLVWKRQYEYMYYQKLKDIDLGNFIIPAHTDSLIAVKKVCCIKEAMMFQVRFWNDFKENNDSRIALTVKDVEADSIVYWHERYLLHFSEKPVNIYQQGLFNYELPRELADKEYELRLVASSGSQKLELKDVSILVFKKK